MLRALVLPPVRGHPNQLSAGTELKHGIGIGLAEEGELARLRRSFGSNSSGVRSRAGVGDAVVRAGGRLLWG